MNTLKIAHRVVLFSKDGLYGAVGIWTNQQRHFVGSSDPRCHPPIHAREYTHLADAEASFADHIKITLSRGWHLAHSGPPNYG